MPIRHLSGGDRGADHDVHAAGSYVLALLVALRATHTHGPSNELTKDAVATLTLTINELVEAKGRADLHLVQERIYVNGVLLRQSRLNSSWISRLIQDLSGRGIGSIIIDTVLSTDDVRRFLDVMWSHSEAGDQAYPLIEAALLTSESKCAVGPIQEVDGGSITGRTEITRREVCKRTFFRAVAVAEEVMKCAHLNRRLQIRFAKRVVQRMVDLMANEESTLLGMTNLKAHDNYTYYHSVNTCLYSIALGRRVGLSVRQLTDLGTAALLHDLGKVSVPVEILRKMGVLSPDERLRIQRHPIDGAKESLRLGRYSSTVLQVMTGALEHHMSFDGSRGGYPRFDTPYRPHIIGRIIAIADCFDAITTKRIYRGEKMRRDKALSFLMSQSGTRFDPVVLKLFANMIGTYPIGTCVSLASGRMGVVTAVPDDPRLCHLPTVQVLSCERGIHNDRVRYPRLDLSQLQLDGTPADEIVEALDAPAMGIDLSRYFL